MNVHVLITTARVTPGAKNRVTPRPVRRLRC